jgi:hypothetical protein
MRLACPARWGVLLCLACLAAAGAQDPKKFPGNKPEKVEPAPDGTLVLPASKCEVYGKTLEYMPEDKALGWWNSADDRAVWKLGSVKPGKYEVWFEWSCADESAGNTFVLKARDHELKGKIPTTGSWQKHEKAKFGTIDLPAGDVNLELVAEGKIKEALGDFREVRLVPAARK